MYITFPAIEKNDSSAQKQHAAQLYFWNKPYNAFTNTRETPYYRAYDTSYCSFST
ncbi:hypothetical protein GCM10023261_12380 [Bartonella jaculi]|uniref:Uncharacterized protein n=1 Tax=Bartonella jaculi TaxID=686226 RepID=A0ABP9N6I6_9HYPH